MSKPTLNPIYSKELLQLEDLKDSHNSPLPRLLFTDKMIERRTIKRLPGSSVLNKVRNFLPKLKNANDDLKEMIANGVDVDIENVNDTEAVIEMNLGLFSCDQDSDSSTTSEDSNDADSSDSDEADEDSPKKKRLITELNSE